MYAREHVRPKLNEIDEDKISKLYAELRRESMARTCVLSVDLLLTIDDFRIVAAFLLRFAILNQ